MTSKSDIFLCLVLAIGLIAGSVMALPEGGTFKGFFVPAWGRWLLLFVGIAILCLTVYGILRGNKETKTYTDDDVRRAKEIMDKMYLREYGKAPDVPQEEPCDNKGSE